MSNPRASLAHPVHLNEVGSSYRYPYNDRAEPFVWTKKKVRQRRFKGRRITQL
ncbi:hypothetical protein [Bradyrhizobium sp. USDA 241]|uniref:hypothetical protein n=1 Tax=Bradyrhizobium sp. USDA 241 TaxID=3377725 RepID=UPI003C76042E